MPRKFPVERLSTLSPSTQGGPVDDPAASEPSATAQTGTVAARGRCAVRRRSRADRCPATAVPVIRTRCRPPTQSLSDLASSLYVDPNSQAAAWVESHGDDPAAREIEERIAGQPTGKWFGAWSGDITDAVSSYTTGAADAGEVPVLIAYNIPERDCGGQSAGGQSDEAEYRRWIDGFDAGLGDRPALVVLEPDALAQLDSCLSDEPAAGSAGHAVLRRGEAAGRRRLGVPRCRATPRWVPADVMAERLQGGRHRAKRTASP